MVTVVQITPVSAITYGLENAVNRPYASHQMAVRMVATVYHQDTVHVLMVTEDSNVRKVGMIVA